jgi:hypothetical protein
MLDNDTYDNTEVKTCREILTAKMHPRKTQLSNIFIKIK